jgi:hypothetical protein
MRLPGAGIEAPSDRGLCGLWVVERMDVECGDLG